MTIEQKFITNQSNFTKGRLGNIVTGIVMHTYGAPGADLSNWWQTNTRGVSAHYCILKDGRVIQYVRNEDSAHHTAGDGNQNVQTIGIEHQDDGDWNNPKTYTQAQLESSAQLIAQLQKKYGFSLEIKKAGGIAKHNMHDPKACPGTLPVDTIVNRARAILKPITSPIPVDPDKAVISDLRAQLDSKQKELTEVRKQASASSEEVKTLAKIVDASKISVEELTSKLSEVQSELNERRYIKSLFSFINLEDIISEIHISDAEKQVLLDFRSNIAKEIFMVINRFFGLFPKTLRPGAYIASAIILSSLMVYLGGLDLSEFVVKVNGENFNLGGVALTGFNNQIIYLFSQLGDRFRSEALQV